ncbi:hypothetical protein FPB0191_01032 [Frischella perrara]|uniref:VRR-NUC domain-containing protein n=1 Tax=Frischella perrara TaxID=1267021 RepID=A0A0A7S063_FRIPE|nr:hypothetical protein [Frischella perrara]AJA44858.1 hypothetical protein FPB0191_01032 [Frischella perrara]
MNGMSDKKTAKPTSVGRSTATTRRDASASGTVLPVVHPVDIFYLCLKMQAAKNSPYICKTNNTPRYQRQVTMWIRQDAASFGYQFPYCGEVGYKMTTIPPTPLMSNSEPFRPSYWPVSKYQMIYREYREANIYGDPTGGYRFDFGGVNVVDSMVNKTTLENELSLKRSRDNDIEKAYRTLNAKVANERFPNGRGMIRIPDVIKKKDHTLTGEKGYHPDNIDTVIEIKFLGDTLSTYQAQDYLKIAGDDPDKLRLMTLKQCEFRNRKDKEEEMLAKAKADPLYQTVGETAMANTKLALSIEQRMQLEYDAIYKHIIKWVKQQEIEYSRPQLVAIDDYNEKNYLKAWQRYEQRHEMIVNYPLAAVGVASMSAMAGAFVAGTSVTEIATTTVVRSGAKVIKFTPITKATVATVGSASLPLAAKQKTTNNYVLERNGQLTYYPEFNEQEKLKYKDDRLIEIDYRYHQNSDFDKINKTIGYIDDSAEAKQNKDKFRLDKNNYKIHYYPYRQQFYYYFTPGDEPTDFEGS